MYVLLNTIETFLRVIENKDTDTDLRISLSTNLVNIITQQYTNIQTEIQNRSTQNYNQEYQTSIEEMIRKLRGDILDLQNAIDHPLENNENDHHSDEYSVIDNREIPKETLNNRQGKLSEELEAKMASLEKYETILAEYKNSYFYNATQSYDDIREAFRHINDLKSSENRTNQLLSNLNTRLSAIETHFEEESKLRERENVISPIQLT